MRPVVNSMICANFMIRTSGYCGGPPLRQGQARASSTILNGVSATRRSVAKPALVTISRSLASPAGARSAVPTSCDRDRRAEQGREAVVGGADRIEVAGDVDRR